MKNTIGKAIRPIFIPNNNSVGVIEKEISFDWHMGMSSVVKQRSINNLHQKAREYGYLTMLEASSKSENPLGIQLSAFFLKDKNGYAVENLFQSSKVFNPNVQFLDLLSVTPREAKKDARLRENGNLKTFRFKDKDYPLEPKSLFYDWLYTSVLYQKHNKKIMNSLIENNFSAFSDIEFNPKRSFNCQARTLALFVSLYMNKVIDEFLSDPTSFLRNNNIYHFNENRKDDSFIDNDKQQLGLDF